MRFWNGYFQVLIFSLIEVRFRNQVYSYPSFLGGIYFILTTHKRHPITMQGVSLDCLRLATLSAALAPARSS